MNKTGTDFWDTVAIPEAEPTEQEFKDTVLLVDADIIAFQSAATTDGREYQVVVPGTTAVNKTFKYHKDALAYKMYLESQDFWDVRIDLKFNPEPEDYALRNVSTSIGALKKRFPGARMEFFLTGKGNFRHSLADDYKENRKDKVKPAHLNACKQHILNRYKGVIIEGMEADDLLGCRQMVFQKEGKRSIIASIDKDLDTIQGEHYNWRKDKLYSIEPLEARRNFYSQCLQGDKSDNILGLKGIGPKKAQAVLKDCKTEYEMYDAVRTEWFKHFFPGFFTDEKKEMLKDQCRIRLEEILVELHRSASLLYILHEPMVMWESPEPSADAMTITEIAQ